MLDLETMGTSANAPIIAIGAVMFDRDGLHEEFYSVVSLESSVENGGVIAPATVLWWMKQSDEARADFSREGIKISAALNAFSTWIEKLTLEYHDKVCVWGTGASFDNTILSEAYARNMKLQPWLFWNDRCFRTLKNLYPNVLPATREGTHHNALDDAKYQAQHAVEIFTYHNRGEIQ